jgi:hypothetical protein
MELFNEYPFNKLPKEIIYMILPYTYQLQSKELTEDIKNYHESKQLLFNKYYKIWLIYYDEEYQLSDKEWIINDLYRYINKNKPTMYGYVDNFYNLFFRKFNIKTKKQVIECIKKFFNKPLNTQINFYWGLLNSKERNEFILSY